MKAIITTSHPDHDLLLFMLCRYYITTSEDLDVIRTKFTFTCDNLSTYEVGKATFGKVLDR